MSNLGKTYVPNMGSREAKIMFVGEAPGKEEEAQREPFVGRSGQLLTRYIQRHGLQRENVYLANLCHYRPKNNKFRFAEGTDELSSGIAELKSDIESIRPNVIVALGGYPMYYLSGKTGANGKPGTGITNWRGSILPGSLVEGTKVIPTVHPAFVERAWKWHPIFAFDIERCVGDMEFPELNLPAYESYIDPPEDLLLSLVSEIHSADWVSVDIETFGDTLACVGFCCDEAWGLCLTCETSSWEIAEGLLHSPTAKIFQFGTYDINYLKHFYGWETTAYAFDTYIAAATLMPEFKRGLDFLTSIYTRLPYYKEERKIWKESSDLNTLWEYNVKDIVATYLIAMKQMEELAS